MTDRVAFHVADNCPHLQWIDISGCPSITVASKNKLLEKLPKLIIIMDYYPNKTKPFAYNYGLNSDTNKQPQKKIAREVSKEEFYTLMLSKKLATHLINSFSSDSISSKLSGMSDIQSENEFNNNRLLPLGNSRPTELPFS